MASENLTAKSFAEQIIEGTGGMNAFEQYEIVVWHTSERVAAAIWTLKCLANPECEGSAEALAAIMELREKKMAAQGANP